MSPRSTTWLIGAGMVALAAVALASSVRIVQRLSAEAPVAVLYADPPEVVPPVGVIAEEALVFRVPLGAFATTAGASRRVAAHPRTLATWRMLRAFPGAPPRIPHGLTTQEVLTTDCKPCHERGGFSQRFGAYAPITPHPELEACIQCHVSDAAVTGISLPGVEPDPDARCRQCHAPGAGPRGYGETNYPASAWPRLTTHAAGAGPPVIPHDLNFRGNCHACHAGPGSVVEIRTTHPDRSNCRQCHLVSTTTETYTRVAAPDADGGLP